jgi:hypothetical protein
MCRERRSKGPSIQAEHLVPYDAFRDGDRKRPKRDRARRRSPPAALVGDVLLHGKLALARLECKLARGQVGGDALRRVPAAGCFFIRSATPLAKESRSLSGCTHPSFRRSDNHSLTILKHSFLSRF